MRYDLVWWFFQWNGLNSSGLLPCWSGDGRVGKLGCFLFCPWIFFGICYLLVDFLHSSLWRAGFSYISSFFSRCCLRWVGRIFLFLSYTQGSKGQELLMFVTCGDSLKSLFVHFSFWWVACCHFAEEELYMFSFLTMLCCCKWTMLLRFL